MALSPLEIKAAQPRPKPYRLSDGGSLFVVVHPSGSKSFEFRYRRSGKLRAIVLGLQGPGPATPTNGTAWAADGLDPSAQRRIAAEEQQVKLADAKAAAAARKAEAKAGADGEGRRQTAADTWAHWTPASPIRSSSPQITSSPTGDQPVADVEPGDILTVGKLLADDKIETARRVRQRWTRSSNTRPQHKLVESGCRAAGDHQGEGGHKANLATNFPAFPGGSAAIRERWAYVGTDHGRCCGS
jgi:hypothetical protein